MATVQTIATTLTADARPAAAVLRAFDGEVDKTFTRLDARTKRFGRSLSEAAAGGSSPMGGGSRGSLGLLEGSRLIEDFSAGFGNNGVVGGIRAANNNLSQMAFLLGGPVAGAVAGFAAAGLGIAAPYIEGFFKATNAARDFGQQMEAVNGIVSRSQANVGREVGFRGMLGGIDASAEAKSAIQKRIDEINVLNAKIHDLNRLRQPWMERAMAPAAGDAAIAERNAAMETDRQLFRQQLDLVRERTMQEKEINQLIEKSELQAKEGEISRQKAQAEFAEGIRGFMRDDLRQQIADNATAQRLVEGRLGGLGAKMDPLAGLDIPEAIKERLSGLLGGSATSRTESAQAVTANSQALARAQAAAKEAAKASQERGRMISELQAILRELKEQGEQSQIDLDDVNLN